MTHWTNASVRSKAEELVGANAPKTIEETIVLVEMGILMVLGLELGERKEGNLVVVSGSVADKLVDFSRTIDMDIEEVVERCTDIGMLSAKTPLYLQNKEGKYVSLYELTKDN